MARIGNRGISPLMATVLLILLSVGLGAAVMSWGEEYIEERAEFVQGVQETITTCDLVSFAVVSIGGVQQFCLDGTTLKGLIDNGLDADISDFHARVIAEQGIFVQESLLDMALTRGSAVPVAFSIGELGSVQQVKLIPKILSGGQQVVCTKQSVLVENIESC
jgi:hypothetical protein